MTRLADLVIRAVKGFGRFWWDFLVGDTPELFIAVIVIEGIIAMVSVRWHDHDAAAIALPSLVVTSLLISLARARRRRS